ncbi:MAG: adenylate/guanylate cyclase domain-containing protein [Spirochaetaceae bacterium]|nr:adenylate/guanylate cyclase domain-containing protein [Spirochaetaceae bacterium]|tara:strand:+ start:44218 stop:46935 length:2718 start_codon:yes stop_codon:yes gene_type:complete
MRKFGLILLLGAAALFIVLPIALGSALLFEWDSMVIFLGLFRELFFTLVPGFLIVGLLLYFYDRIVAYSEANSWTLYLWIGLLLLGSLWYFMAYTAGPASVFIQVENVVPGDEYFSPDLQIFSLYLALTTIVSGGIFLLRAVKDLKWDTLKSGSLLLGFLISLGFSFLLHRVPLIQQMEDQAIGMRYSWMRDPHSQFYGDTGERYCQPPLTKEEQAQQDRERSDEQGTRALTPPPDGIRSDIVILGLDNTTIERLKGKWPLNWEVYGNLVNLSDNSNEAILLFDISFIDEKGVFGGEDCGTKLRCEPLGGNKMVPQSEALANAVKDSQIHVLADFPFEVAAKTMDEIPDIQERTDIISSKFRIERVEHIEHAAHPWGKLMHPPYPDLLRELDGAGYANILKHSSGMNYQMPVVAVYDNPFNKRREVYPGIDLLAAAEYYGVDLRKDVSVDFLKGEVRIENIPEGDSAMVNMDTFEAVPKMAKPNPERTVVIPIDRTGQMLINFRGGRYCFKSYSLLDFMDRAEANENFVNNFDKNIMLVAMYYATGVGTAKDIHLSPYGDMAGIEHHAHALNTILNQDFAHQVSPAVNLLILVAIGLLMGLYQPRIPTWASFAMAIVLSAAFSLVTLLYTFGDLSLIHVFPTALIQMFTVLVGFIGFRALSEEENVKFIRSTFSKFVSQDVVEELLANPDTITLGGSKKELTVFFSDVRGFTTISEKLGPEELVQLLNEYLSEMTELIIDYRGTIDKYMGDAIMAFWGAPARNDDHAYYACVAALAQVQALRRLQEMWSDRNIPVLDIGIGINTGAAVVGNMGSSRRMDYTLMGDTVNLGSRLEGITKTYGVRTCISEFTYERVKDRVYARELDLVRVKGKLEPVRIYELMGLVNPEDIENLKVSRQAQAKTKNE